MTKTTRAAVLVGVGKPLEMMEIGILAPGPGEVQVRIGAAGICRTDLSNARAGGHLPLPIVLGHEGSGVVEAVGEGVTTCAVGDHVVLSLVAQCGDCLWCRAKQPNMCGPGTKAQQGSCLADGHPKFRDGGSEVFQFLGLGTFAEHLIVQDHAVVVIPKDVPFEIAALVGCGVLTGLGAALRTAPAPTGSTVVVIGCGGVGLHVVQGARLAGAAQIIAVDPADDKRVLAARLGATHTVAPGDLAAMVAELTDGIGADVVYDVVGSADTARQAVDVARRGGRVCVIGGRRGTILSIDTVADLLLGGKQIGGCVYGSSDIQRDVPHAIGAYQRGELEIDALISRRIGLEDIDEAFAAMEAGDGVRSVIVP